MKKGSGVVESLRGIVKGFSEGARLRSEATGVVYAVFNFAVDG